MELVDLLHSVVGHFYGHSNYRAGGPLDIDSPTFCGPKIAQEALDLIDPSLIALPVVDTPFEATVEAVQQLPLETYVDYGSFGKFFVRMRDETTRKKLYNGDISYVGNSKEDQLKVISYPHPTNAILAGARLLIRFTNADVNQWKDWAAKPPIRGE